MDNLIKELVFIYGSTTTLSMVFNYLYHTRRAKKAIKESERNLVYKDLSTASNIDLTDLKDTIKLSNVIAMVFSVIPVLQVFYTINNINADPNYLKKYYDIRINEINDQEIEIRKDFLNKIRKIQNLPHPLEERLKDKDYLPSEADYIDVLNYNNSDIIVKTKSLTIVKKNNDSK